MTEADGTAGSMPDCLFCRIAAGRSRRAIVHDDEDVIAIRDIAPARADPHPAHPAPAHPIGAPPSIESDGPLLGRLFAVAADVARSEGIAEDGYPDRDERRRWGGQTVDHLHFHLMGGRAFEWPPG